MSTIVDVFSNYLIAQSPVTELDWQRNEPG
jgi:hypothetical protein